MTDGRIEFKNQNILVENRSKVTITGVEQVESFNDNTIILTTVKGGIVIKGEDLNVGKLNIDNGNINIEGNINGINYSDKGLGHRGNIIGKIFK